MKCPKCGYLGFETSDRCRNCGYDFSLTTTASTTGSELPLRPSDGPGTTLADFDLADARVAPDAGDALQLDRPASRTRTTPSSAAAAESLPLFGSNIDEDAPSITPPPARPPLSVRRTTPEVPRSRRTVSVPARAVHEEQIDFATSVPAATDLPTHPADVIPRGTATELRPAARAARIGAALVDVLLLTGIDAAVIYLTLALAGLRPDAVLSLPLIPLGAFLVILNAGYLIAFVAASGQTIGKMLAGIRVIGDDGARVDTGGAVLRAAGCLLSVVSAGLGYLPAFVSADGRALHDRISGTRVVSAR